MMVRTLLMPTGRVLLAALAALATLVYLGACRQEGQHSLPRPAGVTSGALIIAYSPDSADTFACVGGDSVTVLDRLISVTRSDSIMISTKTYPFGVLIEQVGHRRNGEGGYWLYKVNGAMVPESAGSHRIASGDTVRFFFDER